MSLQDGMGCWAWVRDGVAPGRPTLFLDRDGVVVEEVNYLGRPQDVRLIPAAATVIRAANAADLPAVVVTNQSGVARGRFGWTEFEAVQARMAELLGRQGARLDAVFACGFHEVGQGGLGVADHPWRKPNPGMLLAARERMGADLARSLIVGDRAGDLAAGKAAGLRQGVHVATGHGGPEEQACAAALRDAAFSVALAVDVGGAAAWIEETAARAVSAP